MIVNDDSPNQGKKKQRKAEEQYREDFQRLMSTDWGRRLMWSWLSDCHVFRTSVAAGGDPNMVYFNEGARNIGLQRLSDINLICPSDYLKMLKEAQDNK